MRLCWISWCIFQAAVQTWGELTDFWYQPFVWAFQPAAGTDPRWFLPFRYHYSKNCYLCRSLFDLVAVCLSIERRPCHFSPFGDHKIPCMFSRGPATHRDHTIQCLPPYNYGISCCFDSRSNSGIEASVFRFSPCRSFPFRTSSRGNASTYMIFLRKKH